MDIYTLITIIGMAVAIIGGANTILEFCEKIHSYYQALKKETSARPTLQKNLNYRSLMRGTLILTDF